MDDDYDNYVPQISTLQQDWQNSGVGTGLDGPGGGGGQGGPGNAFLFEGMGQSAGSGGQFQQQRPFPGMGMSGGGQQPQSTATFAGADYGAGGIQGGYQAASGGFLPNAMQSQMAAQQQQMQRQMMGMPPQPGIVGQYGPIGSQGSYSAGQMLPPPPTTTGGGKSTGGSAKGSGKGSKKSKKAQQAAEAAAAAAAAQQATAIEQQQQAAQMIGTASGSGQPQQFPMAGGQMGGFYYKSGPGPPTQPQMMMPSGAGAQSGSQQMAGKWPPQYQQQGQIDEQRQQQFGGQQQMQTAQQQQHYGPLQHLQSQYGPQAQQHLQQQQQQSYPGYHPQTQQSAPKSSNQDQSQQSQQTQQQKQQQQQAAQQQAPGQYNMAQTAAYYGQQQPQQYPPQQSQQPQQTAGSVTGGPTGPSYMGMPHQQQQQQAGPTNYQQMGGYPPGYSSAMVMQQKQAYYAQQQMAAGAAGPPNVPAGAYYQQQPPYGMPNPYIIQQQQQQIYREMYECDQQLQQAILQSQQSQQSPELEMRIKNLQVHRQYLQQAAHHAAAAAAAAAANAGAPMGVTMPMGMAAACGSRDPNQQQTAIQSAPIQQYQPQYPTSAQQGPGSVPVQQQKLTPQPNTQPQPSYGTPQYAAPPAPGGPGFHSPNSGPQSVPPSQQQQPPTPQQVAQPQQHQQMMGAQQYAPPPPAPHMSSPSVAVMSASNQVQVNIRPAEMPGRTMISVYHSPDIPSTSIQPAAVVSSAAMPYQMPPVAIQMGGGDQNGQNLSAKDSIPPEPLPPNLAQEQKRRKQQQQLEQEQQAQQQREQLEHQQQIREQQAKQMQIQQQQHVQSVQSPMTSSHMQIQSPREHQQFSMEPSMAKQMLPSTKAKSPPSRSPQTPPTVNSSVTLNFFGPNQNAMAHCSKTFPIIQSEKLEFCIEEVKEKEVEKPVEIEPIEASASFKDDSEEQRIQQSVKESSPIMNQHENCELNEEEEQPSEINEMLDEEEQQRLQKHAQLMEKIESEEGEETTADVAKDEEKESIIGDEKEEEKEREEIVEEKIQETVEKPQIPQIVESMNYLEAEETMTPSTSDVQLEGKADDKESTADDSQWPGTSTKETSPQDAEDFPFSFRSTKGSTSRKSSAPGGGTRSGKLRNKKRKMDWNRDEDDDYVGSKKKKGRRGGGGGSRKEKAAVEEEAEAMDMVDTTSELLDEELLVEKRRSSRKSAAGKKAKYGEDSENDEALGEPLEPEKTSTDVAMLEPVEERIVEKILGVRMAKRVIRKEKIKELKEEEVTKMNEEEEDGKKRSNAGLEEEEEKGEEEAKINEELPDEKTKKEDDKMEDETLVVQKEEEKDEAKEDELATNNDEKDGKKPEEEPKEKDETEWEEEEIELEELYVKFKGFSYLHCEWKSVEELEEMGDKRVMAKLNRWKQKFGDTISAVGEEDEQEYFNEDYTVVARVLDETYDDREKQHYIFVKWKALPYEDCTWELIQDIPEQKLAEFRRRVEFDTCKLKDQPRLSPAQWSSRLAIPKEKLYKNENVLREYQHEGVNWLLWTWANGRNCILADEMGLGKTVQTIVFFQSLYDIGIHGPFLVVVPLSTLGNWEREFDNWTDINAIVYHGSAHSRRIIQEYEFFYKKSASEAARRRNIPKFDALITTYEVVVQEVEVLKRINFRVCVIDEAHRIKNRNCKLLQTGLLSLKMEHRVLLTGTPLQNNIQELFSLLNFLEPEQFANSEAFLQQFGQCQTEEQVQKLQEILKPMMLRRLKEDVEKELQPKEETIIEVQLSNIQKKYYRAVLERNFTHLMKGTTPSLINTMMQLRKCCNHPYLINGAEEQILAELKLSHAEMSEEQLQVFGLISSSGKLVLIDKLLPKLHADGHKVLIFSQMVRVLDLLEEYLNIKCYPFERIDGNIRGNERQAAIDRFSKPENKDRFVFLLCTRAGGLGINLTAADTVIIFDSDWNPQNDLQAQARCHRIGQTKPVKIYRLITSNTYEREMFDKASLKLGLDKAVLQSMLHRSGTGENIQQMSRQEVEDLLRKGAYGAIMDEDNEGTKFSEEDIDTILQRRTQTIRLEPGVKGSTFAKASFTTSHNRDDIDIGDPDFWSKWAKKANIDMDALNDEYSGKHLIVHEPRSRKKRFEAENFKGNSESGDEAGGTDDDERQSTPGASRIAEGVKSRSARKKRRTAAGGNGGGGGGEDDDDYAYKPDELAFSKTVYFKVEKLLTQWGWGRWVQLKQWSELSEHDLEHISRTLLLHCIREFKGDEKVRDYVWALISPNTGGKTADGKEEKASKTTDSKSKFNQGWAVLPEYNPPFICVDMTFQRHLHRHSNKLLNRVQHLHFLQSQLANNKSEGDDQVQLRTELPDGLDGWLIMPQWDRECDRDLLIGVYKHGMENWEAIRTDASLCFAKKSINFPNTLDLNNRFKYLISVLMKRAETSGTIGTSTAQPTTVNKAAATEVRWTKVEETDFMRILRNYGVKDDTNSENVINWVRFREISIVLRNKTDAEMLEMLYCVLAMCTKQQGGMLSPVDERRADRVEAIPSKSAEKLMNRLHLMRKVHAIITMGIQNIRGMLKMVALDVMPKGWSEAHDEHLLIVVDKFGLEDIHGKLKHLPKLFDAIQPLDEHLLLRRVVEICATLEQGKWTGAASIENLEETTATASGEQGTSGGGQQSTSVIVGKGAKGGGGGGNGNGGNGRKKADSQKQKGSGSTGQGTMDKNAGSSISATGKTSSTNLAGGKGNSGSSSTSTAATMSYNEQQMLMKMMEQMSNPQYLLQLMSMMGPTCTTASSSSANSSNSNAALQQQFQQLQTLLTLTALSGPDLGAASNLSSLTASLASLAGITGSSSSSQGIMPKAASTDVLNLSKKSGVNEGSAKSSSMSSGGLSIPKATSSSSLLNPSTPTSSATLAPTTPQQSATSTPMKSTAFSSADACLSTGLSTSAINKLSQMSVPELLAFSNLAPETRIPVVHAENQQKLEGEKAPTLKSLDQFLRTNPKYSVDLLSLATSHPSLFSATGAGPMMSMTPTTIGSSMAIPKTPTTPVTTKKSAQQQQQGTPNISGTTTPIATPTLKAADKLGTVTALPQASSATSSITQQLMEQTKKGSSKGTMSSSATSSSATAGFPSSISSLFGLDLQSSGTSSSASSAAALNQFLAGLTPSNQQQSSSQIQQSNAAALAALAQGGSSTSSSTSAANSLKNMEQQLLLLQQAALLGGVAASSAAFNPYAALLYTNPTDLFGTKTSSSTSSLQSSFLGNQNATLNAAMSDSTMAAAAAALAQAAGFPSSASGTASNDLTSALTSELYMAAMASTLPSLLGGNVGGQSSSTTSGQSAAAALQANSAAAAAAASLYGSMANAATLEQLLAAAGLGTSSMSATTTSSTQLKGLTGTQTQQQIKSDPIKSSTSQSVASPSLLFAETSSSSTAQFGGKKSGGGMSAATGGKGLKLNAVLEKLASAGAANNATPSSSSPSPLVPQQQTPTTIIEPKTETKSEQIATEDVQKEEEEELVNKNTVEEKMEEEEGRRTAQTAGDDPPKDGHEVEMEKKEENKMEDEKGGKEEQK